VDDVCGHHETKCGKSENRAELMSNLITCEHVGVTYDKITALRDVSFSVEETEFLCIFGENGSGKSTLMKRWSVWFR
jgi:ABC-type sugar transport system ATPase subunit